jgi:hypothetical protein
LSINFAVLAFILLLDGEDILACEEDVFEPLEELLFSCSSDLLESRSKEVPL